MDKENGALGFARLSTNNPHFSHYLEWLLFTLFDADISSYELVFYPRYHLDQSYFLFQIHVLSRRMVVDTYHYYILVTYHPFNIHVFHA